MKKNKTTKSEPNNKPTPSDIEIEERIRQRAYELWERNGNIHGRDLEHWLQAKVEIMGPGNYKEVAE